MAYKCRNCPKQIQYRCIEQATVSQNTKMQMHRAFDAETDTTQMWELLQSNCLLRNRARIQGTTTLDPQQLKQTKTLPGASQKRAKASNKAHLTQLASSSRTVLQRFHLVVRGSKHHIPLPTNGEIVLGRFDPAVQTTPDVDLAYLVRSGYNISRKHALIIARDSKHEIEDVGSISGTFINWHKLRIGQRARLSPGDHITFGQCEFTYTPLPTIDMTSLMKTPKATLTVTSTGHQFRLPDSGIAVVGRSDRSLGMMPDIDLSIEGPSAQYVARRHINIVVRKNRHYVEDLGSANGTRLNGRYIRIGQSDLLNPGDYLWLGGCTLAYDFELPV